MRLAKYLIVWGVGIVAWAGLMVLFSPPIWANLLGSMVFGYGWTILLINEWYYQDEEK